MSESATQKSTFNPNPGPKGWDLQRCWFFGKSEGLLGFLRSRVCEAHGGFRVWCLGARVGFVGYFNGNKRLQSTRFRV